LENNPFNSKLRWPFILLSVWMLTTCLLGVWWLYLIIKLAEQLQLQSSQLTGFFSSNFLQMARWEGSFFILLLLIVSISIIVLYYRDLKKTRNLQIFFSSLSHELKTPLASIRLQGEVINEYLIANEFRNIPRLIERLVDDTQRLEHELEKLLQLSRSQSQSRQRSGTHNLNLQAMPISTLVTSLQESYQRFLKIEVNYAKDFFAENPHPSSNALAFSAKIMVDKTLVFLVFRNLLENSMKYASASGKVTLSISRKENKILITYDDHGSEFTGNLKKLGTLFYQHQGKRGAGVGLYLCKKLLMQMEANLEILKTPSLIFKLSFNREIVTETKLATLPQD
jgi:signal transduction histidine kinase